MPCGAAALGFARIASTHPSSFTLKEQTNRASRSPPALILHCCRQRHQARCYGCLIRNYFSFSPKTEAFSHQLLCCVTYKCAPLNTYGHRNWALPIKQFKDILYETFWVKTLLFYFWRLGTAFLSHIWLLHALLGKLSHAFETSVVALFLYQFECQVNSTQSKLLVRVWQLAQQFT